MLVHPASKPLSPMITQDQFDVATRELGLGRSARSVADRTRLSYTTVSRIQSGELERPETQEGYVIPPPDARCDAGIYNGAKRRGRGLLLQTPNEPE